MAKKNRNTLKRYFKKGSLPTSDQFEDLIDSAINIVDENIDRTDENGFEISLLGANERLISLIRNYAAQSPEWTISYDHENDRLQFSRVGKDNQTLPQLTLTTEQRVGVMTADPQSTLEVAGRIACDERIGRYKTLKPYVDADGSWHDLIGPLKGCSCFEVVARAGLSGSGKHAIMRATAMNAHNPTDFLGGLFGRKKPISYQQGYYLSSASKIVLRWNEGKDGYYLQIKTRCNYGDGGRIYYHVTSLWSDELMENADNSRLSG